MTIPNDAHEWFSFEDPEEMRIWMFDVTFLLSSWTCIFANGCKGVLEYDATELVHGCCSHGAHFSGAKDLQRVRRAARTLTASQWQFRDRGRKEGIVHEDDGAKITRIVDGACIFLNRVGFEGGPGCALHRAALERGEAPLELKPDVCWQLPLRQIDHVDEQSGYVTSMVCQWDRKHWGEAGEDFHWWCTDSPEAFVGSVPAYIALSDELRAMTNEAAFGAVTAYLDERRHTTVLPHPAIRRRARAKTDNATTGTTR